MIPVLFAIGAGWLPQVSLNYYILVDWFMDNKRKTPIRIAIVGIGNCASSLIQGIYYYKHQSAETAIGLMQWDIGGYLPSDIEVVAAFDIDRRKVGVDVNQAIFAAPNCTAIFCRDIPQSSTKVSMSPILDGYAKHLEHYPDNRTFLLSDAVEPTKQQVVQQLKDSGAEMLLNYLPVGSEQASCFFAECALEAGIGFINNVPVFIASDPQWERRFRERGLPVLGDDIKAQLGATVTHRTLMNLFKLRGVKVERTYQLNTGGNTDFLNMLNRERLDSKKKSKTQAVQSVTKEPLDDFDIHVGPSDYVPWQQDNKVCFIRIEGKLFGNIPMNLECRLSVEDSPNSAAIAVDAIRCCKLALDRNLSGAIKEPSSFFFKHPPNQCTDDIAHQLTGEFIQEVC